GQRAAGVGPGRRADSGRGRRTALRPGRGRGRGRHAGAGRLRVTRPAGGAARHPALVAAGADARSRRGVVTGDLFGAPPSGANTPAEPSPGAPLADRMRPRTLDELVGQPQLLAPGSPLALLREG